MCCQIYCAASNAIPLSLKTPYCCDLLAAARVVSAPGSISIPPIVRVMYIGVHCYGTRFPLDAVLIPREPRRIHTYDIGHVLRYCVVRGADNCSPFDLQNTCIVHREFHQWFSCIGLAHVLQMGTTILVEVLLAWDNFSRRF